MVVSSQTQGVLSHNGSTTNGGLQNGSCAPDAVTVEPVSHVTEYYPPNTLGCTQGVNTQLVLKTMLCIELKPTGCR